MKEWAFSVCLATIAGCLTKMVLPKSGMSKLINFMMSIFLLSCMFSGFIFEDFEVEPNFDVIDDVKDISEKLEIMKETKTLGSIEKELQIMVKQDLIDYKINPIKILVNINIQDKSSILINSMEIFIKEGEEYDEKMIKNYIDDKYGVVPIIHSIDLC